VATREAEWVARRAVGTVEMTAVGLMDVQAATRDGSMVRMVGSVEAEESVKEDVEVEERAEEGMEMEEEAAVVLREALRVAQRAA